MDIGSVLIGLAIAVGLVAWLVGESAMVANNPLEQERQAAALERERADPIPRSDIDKILRRQIPVEADADSSARR